MEIYNSTDAADILSFESMLSYSVMGFLTFVAIFATISNTITILVYASKPSSVRNSLIISLAAGDLSSPLLVYWMVISSSFYHEWQYGHIGCQAYAFVNCLVGMAGIGNLTVLSVERFVTLVGSHRQKELLGKLHIPLVASVWLYAIVTSVPPLLGWGRFAQDTFVSSCSFDFFSSDINAQSYFAYLMLIGFVIPLGVISVLYTKIYRTIVIYRKRFEQLPTIYCYPAQNRRFSSLFEMEQLVTADSSSDRKRKSHSSDDIYTDAERKPQRVVKRQIDFTPLSQRLARVEVEFARQTFYMIMGYVVSWTPYAILTLLCQIGMAACYNPLGSAISLMMAKASVAINPVIYAFGSDQTVN